MPNRTTGYRRSWSRGFAALGSLLLLGCGGRQQPSTSFEQAPPSASPAEPAPPPATRIGLDERWSTTCTPPADPSKTNFCDLFDAVTLDDGSIVLAGMLHGQVRLMDRTLKSRGMQNALIVKVSAEGELMWAKHFGRSWHNQAHHIEPGPDGTFFIAGIAANGFHPSMARLKNPNGWENERPFVAVLGEDGTILAAKDLEQRVKDLQAHDGGVWVAGIQGLVERLGPDLGSLERHEYDIDRGYTYEVRLDGRGGLWTTHFIRRDRDYDFEIGRFRPGQAPVHRQIERPTRDIESVKAMAVEQGLIVTLPETRELENSIYYPRSDGSFRIDKPGKYERYIHWWSLNDDGAIRWHHEERLQTAVVPFVKGTPIAMLDLGEEVLTHVASEGQVSIAGLTLAPPNRRGGQFGFIVATDAASGRVTGTIEPRASCNRTGLHVGTGDPLIRGLFTITGDDILLGTSSVACKGRSTHALILSAGELQHR